MTGAKYRTVVTRFAIDAATLVRLVEEGRHEAPEHRLVAPNAIRTDALDLFFDLVRRGERSEEDARQLLRGVSERKMRLLGDRVSRATAWQIAREKNLASVREAEYLAVARLQADALVALDPRLAGLAEGLVPTAPFSALFEES